MHFAFLFAFVAKTPASKNEALKIRAIYEQINIIRVFSARNGISSPKFMAGVTTYRRASFTDDPVFHEATVLAESAGQQVIVSDIHALLRATDPSKILRVLGRLDEIGGRLLDCMTGKSWDQFNDQDRLRVMQEASARKALAQLKKPSRHQDEYDRTPNSSKGADANRKRANQEAARLRPIISSLESSLPAGSKLTPSRVMHHLNEIGEKPRRADAWSINAVKHLLARLAPPE
ncbi:hypothetical protein ACQQ2Q_17940 [Agrobacterium sp. ES01]|uniref:hypothetical protein n=1 Tax=Agrobacterium sp. ES01 TaxID=3420714 RepID=UPI003D0D9B3E